MWGSVPRGIRKKLMKQWRKLAIRPTSPLRACLHEGGGLQVGEVTRGGLPHLTCQRDHIKMRDYMDRWVTPPKWVTSPIQGTIPPRKQTLSYSNTTFKKDVIEWYLRGKKIVTPS